MRDRLLDAYYEYCLTQARAGIIDHSLDAAILAGESVEQHIVETLRAAGELPEGWDREATSVELAPVANGRQQFVREITSPPTTLRNPTQLPKVSGRWLRAS